MSWVHKGLAGSQSQCQWKDQSCTVTVTLPYPPTVQQPAVPTLAGTKFASPLFSLALDGTFLQQHLQGVPELKHRLLKRDPKEDAGSQTHPCWEIQRCCCRSTAAGSSDLE